jgi:hypothetical protein
MLQTTVKVLESLLVDHEERLRMIEGRLGHLEALFFEYADAVDADASRRGVLNGDDGWNAEPTVTLRRRKVATA